MPTGLATFLAIMTKVITKGAKLLVAKNYNKITPAERSAIEALITAAEILSGLLPIPGVDNDPTTFD